MSNKSVMHSALCELLSEIFIDTLSELVAELLLIDIWNVNSPFCWLRTSSFTTYNSCDEAGIVRSTYEHEVLYYGIPGLIALCIKSRTPTVIIYDNLLLKS